MISNCFKVTMSISAAVQLTYWSLNKHNVIIFKATLKEQILESYCQSSMAWKTTVKHPSLKFYFKAISLRGQCQSLMISQNCYLNKYTGIYHVLNSHKKYKNISTRIILWFVLNIFMFLGRTRESNSFVWRESWWDGLQISFKHKNMLQY